MLQQTQLAMMSRDTLATILMPSDVNCFYDDSHSFEVSADHFNHAKTLAQLFCGLQSKR